MVFMTDAQRRSFAADPVALHHAPISTRWLPLVGHHRWQMSRQQVVPASAIDIDQGERSYGG